MAFDEGLLQIWRDALSGNTSITEKRMFGGVAVLYNGHMLCGVHKGGAMIRVGKDNDARAKKLKGISTMTFTKKAMAGWVDISPAALEDPVRRTKLLGMAIAFVQTLPPKI